PVLPALMASPGAPRSPFQEALDLFAAGQMARAEDVLRALAGGESTPPEALELLGGALSAQGRTAEALEWYDRAKAVRPSSPSLRHNRAQALAMLGRPREALAELEEAVRLKPDLHPAWNQMGGVLAALGEIAAAERAYRRALALKPDHAETHYNLGLLFQESARPAEAIACYRKALQARPQFAAAHNNLANALKTRGRNDEALAHYAQAIRLDPGLADAHSNFGTALREAGRVDEAIPLLERAVALKPRAAAVQNNLGIAYFARNRFAEAAQCHSRALEIDPAFHEARNNLGNALAAMGRGEEALACYEAVLGADPDHADAHSNLGLHLQEQGEIEAAMQHYERALAVRPDHSDAINNLGYLLQEQGRREDAMALYERATAADPNNARAAYNLGLARLCRFEFESGWELCELRYRTTPPVAVPRAFPWPRFERGDFGHGHRTAIWREQGVGDQLLYATLLPEFQQRGEGFVLEIDKRLIEAFRRSHPDWTVVAPEGPEERFAGCDRHLAIASLPGLLRISVDSFTRQPHALLVADATRSAGYRARLHAPGARVVGISWRSFQPRARGYVQRKKSVELALFKAMSQREGLRLLDLQYGDTAEERERFAQAGGRLERIEELDLFNDLEGVLAAVEACDVVVTTSNVTAHFAGVLGKPALLFYLAANPPFHYWVPGGDGRSLWYPSVRIVTDSAIDTWTRALERIDELLDA
ncbi:MAG: tetratricopeptide repeat protein, partial [Usitatibacter sp.]